MGFGIESIDSSGKVLFTSDVITFAHRSSGSAVSVAGSSGYSIIALPFNIADYDMPMIGIYCPSYVAFMGMNGSGQPTYACSGGIGTGCGFYVFDLASNIPDAHFGLETYDAAGNRSYSSAQRSLVPRAILDNGQSLTQLGRTLCPVIPAWSGHSLIADTGFCYDNGPAGESWDIGQPCNNLQVAQDSKLYGARVTNGGQSVDVGEISWDDVILSTSAAGHAAYQNHVRPAQIIIADITGFPGSGVFF
jgi:hypothetical protein